MVLFGVMSFAGFRWSFGHGEKQEMMMEMGFGLNYLYLCIREFRMSFSSASLDRYFHLEEEVA